MLKKILLLSQPVHLLFAVFAYLLGVGMARYLGAALRWPVFWLALLTILALQVSFSLFAAYFRVPFTPLGEDETPRQRQAAQVRLLQVAYAALTLSGSVLASLIFLGALDISTFILLILGIIALVVYAIPFVRIPNKGYGELALAAYLSMIIPAFSFLLQMDGFHRLLPLIAFPLTLLALACMLAADFSTFAADQVFSRSTLLTQLTWERAVPVHHVLVLTSYLLFAAAPFFGVSWGLIWPVFLALPFAALQIYWLQRIANGGTPVWKFFNLLVPSLLLLTVYLLALSFWLH